jgi:hypothetical protein
LFYSSIIFKFCQSVPEPFYKIPLRKSINHSFSISGPGDHSQSICLDHLIATWVRPRRFHSQSFCTSNKNLLPMVVVLPLAALVLSPEHWWIRTMLSRMSCFRSRVSRLRSIAARANARSTLEKVILRISKRLATQMSRSCKQKPGELSVRYRRCKNQGKRQKVARKELRTSPRSCIVMSKGTMDIGTEYSLYRPICKRART